MIRRLADSGTIFLALSLFVHAIIFATLTFSRLSSPPARPEVVEVTYETPATVAPQTEEKKRKTSESLEHPIVEQAKQLNDELDVDSNRLSAFNQRVERETKAAQSGRFNNSALGGVAQKGATEKKASESKEPSQDPDVQKKSQADDSGELPSLEALIPKYDHRPEPQAAETANPGQPSQTDDYLPDVQTGIQTLLSTREFIYFSYYQRIKEQIRQYWEPGVREKVKIIYRQGRTIASQKDRTTQLMIILDSKGSLLRIEVLSSSGINQLDDAAVEAFKSAAPFPNPPAGMVESDGTIKIRWDFILEARVEPMVERVYA